jgi:hypothetical protein
MAYTGMPVSDWLAMQYSIPDYKTYWRNEADPFAVWQEVEDIQPRRQHGIFDLLFVCGSYRTVTGDDIVYIKCEDYA